MSKLVNTDLDENQLTIANWILKEASELRDVGDSKLLMFVYHHDLQEFFDLLEQNTSGFWDDGATDLAYNGSNYVIDIYWILKQIGIDPEMVKKEYGADDE